MAQDSSSPDRDSDHRDAVNRGMQQGIQLVANVLNDRPINEGVDIAGEQEASVLLRCLAELCANLVRGYDKKPDVVLSEMQMHALRMTI